MSVHPLSYRSVPEVQKIPGDGDSVKYGNLLYVSCRPAGAYPGRWRAMQIARGEGMNSDLRAHPGGGHEAWRKCIAGAGEFRGGAIHGGPGRTQESAR